MELLSENSDLQAALQDLASNFSVLVYEDYLENPKKHGRIKNPVDRQSDRGHWELYAL